jgi:hypothetical protein
LTRIKRARTHFKGIILPCSDHCSFFSKQITLTTFDGDFGFISQLDDFDIIGALKSGSGDFIYRR